VDGRVNGFRIGIGQKGAVVVFEPHVGEGCLVFRPASARSASAAAGGQCHGRGQKSGHQRLSRHSFLPLLGALVPIAPIRAAGSPPAPGSPEIPDGTNKQKTLSRFLDPVR